MISSELILVTLRSLVGLLPAILLASSLFITAIAISRKLLPQSSSFSSRFCCIAVVTCWLAVAIAEACSLVRQFRLEVILPVMLLLGGLAWKTANLGQFVAELKTHLRTCAQLIGSSRELKAAVVLVCFTFLLHGLRGLVLPPLAWDSLTYHLVKSGSWVQSAGWTYNHGPESWNFYNFFPYGGELLWAWAMLPMSTDALVAPAGLLVWGGCVTGAYATARSLGATPVASMFIALAIASIPSAMNSSTIGYVDNVGLMYLLCGFPFLVTWSEKTSRVGLFLWLVALAMAAGVKTTFLPGLIIGVGLVLISIIVKKPRKLHFLTALLAAIVVAIPCLASYIRAWVLQGSPLYPFELRFGETILLAGDPYLRAVLSEPPRAALVSTPLWYQLAQHLYHLFGWAVLSLKYQHMNLGLGSLLLLLMVVIKLPCVLKSHHCGTVLTMLCVASACTVGLFLPSNVALWYSWWSIIGRFFMPLMAVCILLLAPLLKPASAVSRPGLIDALHQKLFLVAILLSTIAGIPRGWGWSGLMATAWILLETAFLFLILLLVRKKPRVTRIVTGAAVAFVFALSCFIIRSSVRFLVYEEASHPAHPPFQAHRLELPTDSPAEIWKTVDASGPGLTLACTAGAAGENWFVYPLMGQRLQHRVKYVSPACDEKSGTDDLITPSSSQRCLSYEDWILRLSAERVDAVVVMNPPGIEMGWMQANPTRFKPLAMSPGYSQAAYRFVGKAEK